MQLLGKNPTFGCSSAYLHSRSHGSIDVICAVVDSEMPFKPPMVAELDLQRARQIVSSLAPLKGLNSDGAEIVARIIALSYAEGRQRGVDIAKEWSDADWKRFCSRGDVF